MLDKVINITKFNSSLLVSKIEKMAVHM